MASRTEEIREIVQASLYKIAKKRLVQVAAQAAADHVCDRTFQLDGVGESYPVCRTCGTIDYDGTHRSAQVVDAILAELERTS